jgi:hypothetical protein
MAQDHIEVEGVCGFSHLLLLVKERFGDGLHIYASSIVYL